MRKLPILIFLLLASCGLDINTSLSYKVFPGSIQTEPALPELKPPPA